ncbi:MAG: hypothetical protein ACYDDO_09265 [Acidiferrobacterales bacterium]
MDIDDCSRYTSHNFRHELDPVMQQLQSHKEYLDLIDQALFEVDDLMRCAEEEGDGVQEYDAQIPVYEQLAAGLARLRDEVARDTHAFGDGKDLAIMSLVRQWKSRIPFHGLLETLNTVHRSGF